jgi:hypothetical protein
MSLTVRRVVTGHDENGRAIVSIDETSATTPAWPVAARAQQPERVRRIGVRDPR